MLANVIEGNYPGAAAIKDAPAEIPSAATLAALDNLGPPSTPAGGGRRPRWWRRSASWARWSSRLRHPLGPRQHRWTPRRRHHHSGV